MRIHFIAMGGSAMHNLALALQKTGNKISGSDDAFFNPSKIRLKDAGLLPPENGWFPEKITKDIDAVILGMHAKPDNPELIKAQELGVKIYSYPEFLYEHSKDKIRIVIGGSHGKTTITSMILHVLHYLKREVDFMVGAQLEGFDTMVHLTTKNKYIILEGDEYLTSPIDRRPKFHWYKAHIALLSGIAWDHINVFPTFQNYRAQFVDFLKTMDPAGTLVYYQNDKNLKEIVTQSTSPKHFKPYDIPQSEIRDGQTFLITETGEVPLQIFGTHNLANLNGALQICLEIGIPKKDFYRALRSFSGAAKRLEKIAEKNSTVIFKDFAHSPSKVKATTKAVRQQYPQKKLLACLELHTYSSLNVQFLKQYKNTLETADEAWVFYAPEAVKIKRLTPIQPAQIKAAFNFPRLKVFTTPQAFRRALHGRDLKDTALLLMSSGNYGGLNFDDLIHWI